MHNIETRSQNFANGRHPWVPAKLSSYLYPCPSPRIFFSLVAWNGILYWSLLLLEDNLQIITYAELFLRSDGGHSPLSLTPLTISYRINRGSPAGRRCPQASMYDVRHSALVTRLHRKFVIQSTEKKTSPVVAGAMYWMSESVTDWMNEWMNEWSQTSCINGTETDLTFIINSRYSRCCHGFYVVTSPYRRTCAWTTHPDTLTHTGGPMLISSQAYVWTPGSLGAAVTVWRMLAL